MNSIYWILTLDSIVGVLITLTVVLSVIVLSYIVMFLFGKSDEEEDMIKCSKKGFKWSIPTLIVSILLSVFVPNSKQMLTIIGVGGTIEYLEENDTAKQLPDKCIIALDKLMDEYIDKKNKLNI